MCSNTIYILNNTIIECFDIALNKKKKKKSIFLSYFMLQKRNEQPPFQNGFIERNTSCEILESYPIVHV